MIELNESFLAGFVLAVILNCLYAFLGGFFGALFKDLKRKRALKKAAEVDAPLRMPKYINTPVLMTCDKCNGTGRMKSEVGEDEKCNVCFGRGQAFGAIREKFTYPPDRKDPSNEAY